MWHFSGQKVSKKCWKTVKCIGLLLTGELEHPLHSRGNLSAKMGPFEGGSHPRLCWPILALCWGYVEPSLALCWAILGAILDLRVPPRGDFGLCCFYDFTRIPKFCLKKLPPVACEAPGPFLQHHFSQKATAGKQAKQGKAGDKEKKKKNFVVHWPPRPRTSEAATLDLPDSSVDTNNWETLVKTSQRQRTKPKHQKPNATDPKVSHHPQCVHG